METFFFHIAFTNSRPIVVDEHWTGVAIASDRGLHDARLAAAQMVGTRCEMVTRVDLAYVEV